MAQPTSESGRYRRLRLLGEGGAGRVWLVEDRLQPERRLALKELVDSSRGNEVALRREFATLANLRHPNLVEVHQFDLSSTTGTAEFTLEYIEGLDIVATAREEGAESLLDLTAETLRALAFLHDFGLIHRDLKPANLLVRREPRRGVRLVVLDFGLALRGETRDEDGRGGPGGTLAYMAPELFAGKQADRKTDLYALGALLHEAVHGAPPYEPDPRDLAGFIERINSGKRSRPPLPAGYPAGLISWLEELIAPDPAERPAGAQEALARLNACCATDYEMETGATRAARLASGKPPGREKELERLLEYLEDQRGPRVVWLAGDAGMGKTRTLRWLAAEVVGRGGEVGDSLRSGADRESLEPKTASIEESLRKFCEAAADRPSVLLFDELEAADERMATLVERIARDSAGGGKLKVVAALRPAEVRSPILRQLLRDSDLLPAVERIELGPMDLAAVRELVERAEGGKAKLSQRARWLHQVSEGNPLVLESLIVEQSWERGGKAVRQRSIEESIAGRMEGLSREAREWIAALVVLGPAGSTNRVGELSGLEPVQIAVAAEETAAAGLVTERQSYWVPASRMIAGQVLLRLDPERRRALHSRAAALLESCSGPPVDPGRLARLWAAAGERGRAKERALEAAERAESERRFSEAAGWLRLALLQLDRVDPARLPLRSRHADALLEALDHHSAYRALATCLRLEDDSAVRAGLLAKQARTLIALARYRKAIELAREAQAIAGSEVAPEVEALCSRVIGMAQYRLGQFEESIVAFTKAAEGYDRLGDLYEQADCLYLAAIGVSSLRNIPEARRRLDEALRYAEESGDVRLKANILVSLGNLEARAWRIAEALAYLDQARLLTIEHDGLKRQHAAILVGMAAQLTDLGRLDRALDAAREGGNIALNLGSKNWLLFAMLNEANALVLAGRPAEAVTTIEKTLDKVGDLEVESLGFVKITLAEALVESPNLDHARIAALVQEALDSARENPKQTLGALLVEMERRVLPGCAEPFPPIREEYERQLEQHPDGFEPPYKSRAELALTRHLIDSGQLDAAESSAMATAAFAEEKSLPDYAARAHALLAEIQRESGRAAAADESLARGRELLDEAAARIEDESLRRDYLDRPVYRALRESARPGPTTGEERLLAIYDMIRALNSETDPESILDSTLDMALKVVRAERGMILLREPDGEHRVRVARNLEQETIRDASEFSSNVVLQAGEGKAVLAVNTGEDERLRELKSVSMYGIRSVLCVPLRLRGEITGAVYLDSRSDASLFSPEDLRFLEAFADHAALALENARARRQLEQENQRLQRAAESRVQFDNIVGRAPAMQQVYELIRKVADNNLPVLIQGESGTGKELVARAIHFNGPRRRKPFVSENCAAIPETLLESELFGHVKGAFTGAERDRSGLFEQAHGGTLMLDEVGDMSAGMQARLLRVVQEGAVRRVGAERWNRVDVRVIAATHRDLAEEVREGRFREDLLYRLHVLVIPLPPLRDRPGDIPLLLDHFLRKIGKERDRPVPRLRAAVADLLERYRWPGNIRQLENTLQRLTLLAGEAPITLGVVEADRELRRVLIGESDDAAPVYSLERSEEQQIREALRAAGGNRTKAARMLGISRATIFRKIKLFGLN